ncbi:hypothetical protein KA977_12020 [Candidatus Dependentiae bacterium]|nr:hypothetical protein [Candidatus Dependentiae bacterium]
MQDDENKSIKKRIVEMISEFSIKNNIAATKLYIPRKEANYLTLEVQNIPRTESFESYIKSNGNRFLGMAVIWDAQQLKVE